MKMLEEMMVFAQVVESGGFSAAARQLDLEASSVSRSVARLERHLGARLLHRTTRAIALTEVGEQVFSACTRIAATARSIRTLADRSHAQPRGTLRLSAPVAFGQLWLAPRLAGFMEACPEVDLRITLIDRPVDLIEDGVDLAIRIADDLPPGLVSRKLFCVRYVLIASPAYLDSHGSPETPVDLIAHRCLYLGHGAFGSTWAMRRGEEVSTVTVASRTTLNNSIAIAAAAEAGGGIGLIPDFSARHGLESGRLVQVLPDWRLGGTYRRDVSMVYLPGPHVPHMMRAFIDYMVAAV